MTNRKTRWVSVGTILLTAACAGLVGCGGGEPEPVAVRPAAPPPPPPPPAPKITPVDQLMAQLGIDERIAMDEGKAPDNDDDRKAVLAFFDAFARGDAQTLGEMMTMLDQVELRELERSGALSRSIDGLTQIMVETGEVNGTQCALGIFAVGGTYQAQLWYFRNESGGHVFESAPTPPNMISRLSGDWIQSWHEILEDEINLAMMPDIEIDTSVAADDEGDDDRSGRRRGSRGPQQPGGGGAGGLREPPSEPVKPPGG